MAHAKPMCNRQPSIELVMRFERPARVKYSKNPLVEVVCEVRFPTQLAIQQSLPVDFQAIVATVYPFLEMAQEVHMEISTLPAATGDQHPASASGVAQVRKTVYEFVSIDRQSRISLSDQWLRLSTVAYDSWEKFESQFIDAMGALTRVYAIEYFTRLSLRYRDLIDRKVLNCESVEWNELIQPGMLGALSAYKVASKDCEGFQQSMRLKLDRGAVNITHALVRHIEGHSAFLIDADFFLVETFKPETSHVTDTLRSYNVQAGGLFRSTITERLHALLEPGSVI
jgi:uncharacterized protein (TIGR04255 family)